MLKKVCLFFKRMTLLKKSIDRFFYGLHRHNQKKAENCGIHLIHSEIEKPLKNGVFFAK